MYALTFDDGPSPSSSTLLATLTAAGIKASFFAVGTQIDEFPNTLKQEVNQGHSTLSHTNTHPDLTTLTLQNKYFELARTTSAFKNSGVCKRPTLFRPPFGSTDTEVEELAGRMGLRGVLWNVDTLDWKLAVGSPSKMLADFKTNLANTGTAGVIQLSHDLIAATVNQVPKELAIINANVPKKNNFISIERCVWGPGYLSHPSYAFMNRLCPSSVTKWPATTGCPLSDWSVWSPCDANCGTGLRTRVRYSLPPSLATTSACASVTNSGLGFIQTQACSADKACVATGCTLSAWTAWGPCSKACGGGTQLQTRTITTGSPSTCGPVLRMQVCNTKAC